MDLATGQAQQISESSDDESPSFAPNGRLIAYATRAGGKEVLMTTTLDGKNKVPLLVTVAQVREPAWGRLGAEAAAFLVPASPSLPSLCMAARTSCWTIRGPHRLRAQLSESVLVEMPHMKLARFALSFVAAAALVGCGSTVKLEDPAPVVKADQTPTPVQPKG